MLRGGILAFADGGKPTADQLTEWVNWNWDLSGRWKRVMYPYVMSWFYLIWSDLISFDGIIIWYPNDIICWCAPCAQIPLSAQHCVSTRKHNLNFLRPRWSTTLGWRPSSSRGALGFLWAFNVDDFVDALRRPGLAAAPVAVAVAAAVLPPEVRQLQAEMPQVVLLRRKRPLGPEMWGTIGDLNSFLEETHSLLGNWGAGCQGSLSLWATMQS